MIGDLKPVYIWSCEKVVFTGSLSRHINDDYKELNLNLGRDYSWSVQGVYLPWGSFNLTIL